MAAVCVLVDAVVLQPLFAAEPTPETEWLFVDETKDSGLSDPLFADGMVIVGSDGEMVYAFEAKTGKETWRHVHGARVCDRPDFLDELVFIISADKGAAALNRRNGTLVWSGPAHRRFAGGFGSLAVSPAAKLVFLGGYDGMVRST